MSAISKGQVNFSIDNVCQGLKPNKIVVAFADSQSVAGSYNHSPWNFKGFYLSELTVSVDGIPVLRNPVTVKFDSVSGLDVTEPYHWMVKSSGKWLADEGNQLSLSDLGGGYALYTFDLEPSFQDRGYRSLIKQGIVRIIANVSKPLPLPANIIIYTETVGYFETHKTRDVIVYQ